MKDYQKDMVLACVAAAVAAAILLLVPDQVRIITTGNRAQVTAQTFPILAGVLLLASAAGLFGKSLLQRRQEQQVASAESGAPEAEPSDRKKTALAFLFMLVYIIIMNRTGFLLSSLLFGGAFLYLNGIRKWWQYVIFAGMAFATFALFKYGLYVPLPTLGLL